jgi:hypothetical protein
VRDFAVTRRDLAALPGSGAGWPLGARAQGLPVFALLASGAPDLTPDRVGALHDGLRRSGCIEGRNVAVECADAVIE